MNLPPQAPEFALRTSKMRVWDWRGWRLNWDWRIVGLEELEGLEGLDAKPNWTLEGLECGIGGVGEVWRLNWVIGIWRGEVWSGAQRHQN